MLPAKDLSLQPLAALGQDVPRLRWERMSTANHPNNVRLRQLIEDARLTQAAALTLFNRGQARPITESGFKAWLAAPDSTRWRELSDAYVEHAEKVYAKVARRS